MLGGPAKIRFEQLLLNRFARLPQVTIAKLRGHVLGGGAELMLACDFRLAAESASIGFPEIKLGALPAAGGMKRLVRDVGPVRARDLVLRGRALPAREASGIGLVTECVPDAELDAAVAGLAAELAALPADALRLAKRCIDAAGGPAEIDTAEAEAFAELYRGANLREGLKAFTEKRPPKFNR
jgi:enoyl-CoA hydratase/carnithine racemase